MQCRGQGWKIFWVNERSLYLQKDEGANGPFWKLFISYNPVAIDLLQAFDILSMFQLNSWWLLFSKCCFLDFLFPKLLALVAEVAGTLPWLAERRTLEKRHKFMKYIKMFSSHLVRLAQRKAVFFPSSFTRRFTRLASLNVISLLL